MTEDKHKSLPFPFLSSLLEERKSGLEHESHERRGHVPSRRITGDDSQQPDGRDTVQPEQSSHEDRSRYDEPPHRAISHPARRLLPGPRACAPRSPEPEEVLTAGSSYHASARRRHRGVGLLVCLFHQCLGPVFSLMCLLAQHYPECTVCTRTGGSPPPQMQNVGGPSQ